MADVISLVAETSARRTSGPSRERPIDLVFLARHTMGDQALEAEILTMMEHQIMLFAGRLDGATGEGRATIAHAMAGAARNVGAFPLAAAAAALEQNPAIAERQASFRAEMKRALDFIRQIGSAEVRCSARG